MQTVSRPLEARAADNLYRLALFAMSGSPERLIEILLQADSIPQSEDMWTAVLEVNGQKLMLSQTKAQLLQVISHRSGRPELVLKAFETVPWLRELAEQAGSVDDLLSGQILKRIPPDKDPDTYVGPRETYLKNRRRASGLLRDLGRLLSFDPQKVREEIRRIALEGGGFDRLASTADIARYRNRTLAFLMLQELRLRLDAEEPADALGRLARLLRLELALEGVPRAATIEACLTAWQSIQAAEVPGADRELWRKAEDLHLQAVAAWARLDYPAAIREIELLPAEDRLRYLRSIIRRLT